MVHPNHDEPMTGEFFRQKGVLFTGPSPRRAEDDRWKPVAAGHRNLCTRVDVNQTKMQVFEGGSCAGVIGLRFANLIGGIPNVDHELSALSRPRIVWLQTIRIH